jgi:hypothetical protein
MNIRAIVDRVASNLRRAYVHVVKEPDNTFYVQEGGVTPLAHGKVLPDRLKTIDEAIALALKQVPDATDVMGWERVDDPKHKRFKNMRLPSMSKRATFQVSDAETEYPHFIEEEKSGQRVLTDSEDEDRE